MREIPNLWGYEGNSLFHFLTNQEIVAGGEANDVLQRVPGFSVKQCHKPSPVSPEIEVLEKP